MRIALVLLLSISSFAQTDKDLSQSSSAIPLRNIDLRIMEGKEAEPFLSDTKCDDNGSIYFMGYQDGDFDTSSLIRMTTKPELSLIQMTRLPGLGWKGTGAFAVFRDGATAMVVSQTLDYAKKPKFFVSIFDKDGNYRSHIPIDEEIVPTQLVAFATGDFLLAGRKEKRTKEGVSSRPFVGVFDREGKKVKDLSLEGEERFAKEMSDVGNKGPAGNESFQAIDLSRLVLGPEGNAYLMRFTSPPQLHVIDPSGNVVKSFRIDPPLPGMLSYGIQASANYIAVRFRPPTGGGGVLIKTVSPLTGEQINLFSTDVSGAFACYTAPDRFHFLTSRKKRMATVIASP